MTICLITPTSRSVGLYLLGSTKKSSFKLSILTEHSKFSICWLSWSINWLCVTLPRRKTSILSPIFRTTSLFFVFIILFLLPLIFIGNTQTFKLIPIQCLPPSLTFIFFDIILFFWVNFESFVITYSDYNIETKHSNQFDSKTTQKKASF